MSLEVARTELRREPRRSASFPLPAFWSKDEILAEAFLHRNESLQVWIYIAAVVGAIFTAFSMGRQIGLVFFGKPRTALAEHAVEPGKRMTWPLLVLGVFSLLFGFINVPEDFPFIGNGWYHGFVGEVFLFAEEAAPGIVFEAVPFSWWVAISSTILGVASFAFGWWLYTRRQSPTEEDAIQGVPVIGRPAFTILISTISTNTSGVRLRPGGRISGGTSRPGSN